MQVVVQVGLAAGSVGKTCETDEIIICFFPGTLFHPAWHPRRCYHLEGNLPLCGTHDVVSSPLPSVLPLVEACS